MFIAVFFALIGLILIFYFQRREDKESKNGSIIYSQWLVSGYVFFFSLIVLMASGVQFNFIELFFIFSMKIWLMSAFFILPLFLLFYGLFGVYYSNILSLILSTSFAILNSFKIAIRTDSLVPQDFSIQQLKEMSQSMLNGELKASIFLVSCVIFLLFIFSAFWFWKYQVILRRKRWNLRMLSCLFGLFLIFGLSKNSQVLLKNSGVNSYFFSPQMSQESNGSIIHFVSRLGDKLMEKPQTYSKKRMEEIQRQLTDRYTTNSPANRATATPNVVFILSEAFWDPMKLKNVTWSEDPIPNLRQLIQNNGGDFFSPEFGGNTANVEYNVLTGFSSNFIQGGTVPYVKLSNKATNPYSLVNNFNELGYSTTSIHPYSNKFYNRDILFKKFQFNSILFENDVQNHDTSGLGLYISDQSLFKEIQQKDNEEQEPYFLHTISMQNHYPYTSDFKYGTSTFVKEKESESGIRELNNYARGLQATDKAVKRLLEYYKKKNEETIIVFYGDHLPVLNDQLLSQGLVQDSETEKHKTDYFVWSNKRDLGVKGEISANYLATVTMKAAGMKLSPFQEFLNELHQEIPAFGYNFDRNNLSTENQELIETYELLQYDQIQGENYASDCFETKGER